MNALDQAKTDPRIQSILTEVSSRVKVDYVAAEHQGWGSNMEDGMAEISWSDCRHPSASLMHELLHIRLQLSGYRRIRFGISNVADPETCKLLMDCLDNELQHHKFYADFIAAGFSPDQFYMDSDADTEKFLDAEIDAGFTSTAAAAIVFFSLIAPGGSLSESAETRLRQRLETLDNGAHAAAFGGIAAAVQDWIASPSSDARTTIRRILLAIRPNENLTWYGFQADDRPDNGGGLFVDQSFRVREC